MNEHIDQKQFLEWTEQYANGTIAPADAEQLLELVQSDREKQIASEEAYDGFRARYLARREDLGAGRFDRLVNETVNNAYLVSVGTYEDWIPAFVCLFQRSSGWSEFYSEVESLTSMEESSRTLALNACVNEELDTSLL